MASEAAHQKEQTKLQKVKVAEGSSSLFVNNIDQ